MQRAAAFNSHASRRDALQSFLASDAKLPPSFPDSRCVSRLCSRATDMTRCMRHGLHAEDLMRGRDEHHLAPLPQTHHHKPTPALWPGPPYPCILAVANLALQPCAHPHKVFPVLQSGTPLTLNPGFSWVTFSRCRDAFGGSVRSYGGGSSCVTLCGGAGLG